MSQLSLEKIKEIIIEEKRNWLSRYASESKIREEVIKRLDGEFNKLILKVLNVEDAIKSHYGPPHAKLIKENINRAIDLWVEKQKLTGPPQVTEKDIEEINQIYKQNYMSSLKVYAKSFAEENAQSVIEQLINKTLLSDEV